MTSSEITADMRIGWNLGNSLECYNSPADICCETYWGNPLTSENIILDVQKKGFNAIRIPVSWGEHTDSSNIIDQKWLGRVKQITDFVLDNGMYAIINVHHDDYLWLSPSFENQEKVSLRYEAIWKQICSCFEDYGEKLLFEAMNEPRIIGGENEWTCGTEESRTVINSLIKIFCRTVRNSGGYNPSRHLIIPTHAASPDNTAISSLEIPDCDNIIVDVHNYAPWDFAGNESDRCKWGSDEDKALLDCGFDRLYETFVKKGIPVIIGEFGAVDKKNASKRAAYLNYYVKSAGKRNITCFIWDDGAEFRLLDRNNHTWHFPEIVDGIMNAVS